MDVIEHLIKEHRQAESLLQQLEASADGNRDALMEELETALETHMAVEEQFLYPIVDEALGPEKTEGAETEHELMREGLANMRELVGSPGFGAALQMLKAGMAHHVEEEEREMFPQLKQRAGDEVAALGDAEKLEGRLVYEEDVEFEQTGE